MSEPKRTREFLEGEAATVLERMPELDPPAMAMDEVWEKVEAAILLPSPPEGTPPAVEPEPNASSGATSTGSTSAVGASKAATATIALKAGVALGIAALGLVGLMMFRNGDAKPVGPRASGLASEASVSTTAEQSTPPVPGKSNEGLLAIRGESNAIDSMPRAVIASPSSQIRKHKARPEAEFVAPTARETMTAVEAQSSALQEVGSTLREETRALLQARARLRSGDSAGALAALDSMDQRYPKGQLADEREALRIQALFAVGRAQEGHRLGQRFLRSFPSSPHADRVRRAMDQNQ